MGEPLSLPQQNAYVVGVGKDGWTTYVLHDIETANLTLTAGASESLSTRTIQGILLSLIYISFLI